MHEEIEYAEMLEIPVSTVNVIRKKSRRKKAGKSVETESAPLKDSVIEQVNTRVEETPENISVDADVFAEGANSEGYVNFDPIPDRIDTVRLFADEQERKAAFEEEYSFDFKENEGGRYALNEETRAQKAARITLGTEFALACALCGAIFLTNVFMPNSAVNTFFRAVNNPDATVATVDNRSYSDFELSPVVSELSDAELSLSAAGILSFKDECCVYPAADGKVSEVSQNTDGTYTLKISHSDSFTGVIGGLNNVYYTVGETVKCNVPVGYSKGETEVQVTMYSGGVLLNCFQITEENCLAWLEE